MREISFTLKIAILILIFSLFIPYIAHSEESLLYIEEQINLTEQEIDWLEEDNTVRVRVGNWPPFMIIDESKQPAIIEGIAIEYIETIFDYHGINYEYIMPSQYTFGESIEAIKNKEYIDIIPTAKITEERLQYISFSDTYIEAPWVVYTRTDSPFISSLEDLSCKTVVIPSSYAIKDVLVEQYPSINLLEIEGTDSLVENCLEQLAIGNADAYIGNLTVASYLINKNGYSNIKVAAPTNFENHKNSIAIRDDWVELTSIVNKTLETFSSKDHIAIRHQWLDIQYDHGIRWWDVLIWIMIIILVFLILLYWILRWNSKLRKEISMREEAEKKNEEILDTLNQYAITDSLTGIFNRREFYKRLNELIISHDSENSIFCLAILDIDHFKSINDTYGHSIGDFVLSQTAKLIQMNLRSSDFVARIGGDEFAMIIYGCNEKCAYKTLHKIVDVISMYKYNYEGLSDIKVTVSIGATL